jgi:deoxyribodipyrimidine photo-lyase
LASEWKANHIFANIEYEMDELRRDIVTLELCRKKGLSCVFTSDKCIVEPGTIKTQQGKPYAVYTPWLNNWLPTLHKHPEYLEESPPPVANPETVHDSPVFSPLFSTLVPTTLEGFECTDKEKMDELWPAGADAAIKVRVASAFKGEPRVNLSIAIA